MFFIRFRPCKVLLSEAWAECISTTLCPLTSCTFWSQIFAISFLQKLFKTFRCVFLVIFGGKVKLVKKLCRFKVYWKFHVPTLYNSFIRILPWKIVVILTLDGVSAKCNQNSIDSVCFGISILTEVKVIGIFRLKPW